MYIHLPGRHYDVNLFHPQAFLSEQSLQVCQYFIFFWAVSRQYAVAMFGFTRLFISFTVKQVASGLPGRVFFLSGGPFRKI